MSESIDRFIVTEDPDQLARLRAKAEVLGTRELGAYAMSLGLYPPGFVDGDEHGIAQYTPAGSGEAPLLIWSSGVPGRPAPNELADDDDEVDDDDVWGDLIADDEDGPTRV